MTREMKLTQGKVALISEEDYERVSSLSWHAVKTTDSKNEKWYARAWNPATQSKVYMHRFINETPEGMETDHRDGDGLNNTRDNLRSATVSQNLLNRKKMRSDVCKSQYKGVSQDTRLKKSNKIWIARLAHSVAKRHGVSQHLGTFATEIEAAKAYDEAIRKLHPEYAVYNF